MTSTNSYSLTLVVGVVMMFLLVSPAFGTNDTTPKPALLPTKDGRDGYCLNKKEWTTADGITPPGCICKAKDDKKNCDCTCAPHARCVMKFGRSRFGNLTEVQVTDKSTTFFCLCDPVFDAGKKKIVEYALYSPKSWKPEDLDYAKIGTCVHPKENENEKPDKKKN